MWTVPFIDTIFQIYLYCWRYICWIKVLLWETFIRYIYIFFFFSFPVYSILQQHYDSSVDWWFWNVSACELAGVRPDKGRVDFQVEDSHWPSDIRKWLLLKPGGFPNLAGPRTLLRDPWLQKWLGRCMTGTSSIAHRNPVVSSRQMKHLHHPQKDVRHRIDICMRYDSIHIL